MYSNDERHDYARGYQDGLQAAREALEHGKADTVLGEMVGDILAVVETIVAEACTFGESEAYQEGFRAGVRDGLGA